MNTTITLLFLLLSGETDYYWISIKYQITVTCVKKYFLSLFVKFGIQDFKYLPL